MTNRQDNWLRAEATILKCRPAWLHSGSMDDAASVARYKAEYVYEVDGNTYRGQMYVGDPDCIGREFDVLFDPAQPKQNSALDQVRSIRSIRFWAVAIGSVFIAVLLYWLNIH